MEDTQRILEKHALRNVRTLVDTLGHEERAARKKQKYLFLWAIVPVLLVFWVIYQAAMEGAARDAAVHTPRSSSSLTACESEGAAARSEAYDRDLRRSNPGLTKQQRIERLARERPFFLAAAQVECNAKAR